MPLGIGVKVGGFLIVGSGITGVVTVAVVYQNLIVKYGTSDAENTTIYAISNEVSGFLNQDIDNSPKSVEDYKYHCKYGNFKYQCKITLPGKNIDNKNHISKSEVTAVSKPPTPNTVTKDKLNQKEQIFAITINKSIGNGWEYGKISVMPNVADEDKQYALLTPLFAIDSSKKIISHKNTKYFVGKAKAPVGNIADYNKKTICKFGDALPEPATDSSNSLETSKNEGFSCKIFPFATTENPLNNSGSYSSLTFSSTETDPTTIQEHKHYLIDLSEPQVFQDKQTTLVYGNDKTQQTVLENIKPAFYLEQTKKIIIID